MFNRKFGYAVGLGFLATMGCSVAAPTAARAPQVKAARGFPGAVTLDAYKDGKLTAQCSGTLIGPKTVLTAGSCAQGMSTWKVNAPYAGAGQSSVSVGGDMINWNSGEPGTKTLKWIAVVYLDKPIHLKRYPKVGDPSKCLAKGCDVFVVSREAAIVNGKQSMDVPTSAVPRATAR